MGRGERNQKTPPVSVALTKPDRSTFQAEAKRRRLGLSTTIRTLALERAGEIELERQRERARRWQGDRLRGLIERIEREGFQEATQAQIDAIFDRAQSEAQPRRARAAAGR